MHLLGPLQSLRYAASFPILLQKQQHAQIQGHILILLLVFSIFVLAGTAQPSPKFTVKNKVCYVAVLCLSRYNLKIVHLFPKEKHWCPPFNF